MSGLGKRRFLRLWLAVATAMALPCAPAEAAGGVAVAASAPAGHVWAWGFTQYGQLGDGNGYAFRGTPQPVALSQVVAVAAPPYGYHTLALREDGSLWGWGGNWSGQLGDGTTTNRFTPVRAALGLDGIAAVAAGFDFSLALRSDGTVWIWGDGNPNPRPVAGLDGVVAVAAGATHALALRADGSVWAWARSGYYDDYGQLGTGTPTQTPMRVPSLPPIRAIAAGPFQSFAVDQEGGLWAWGRNDYAQLGDGTTTNRPAPVRVSGLPPLASVASGFGHTVALAADASLWAWGANSHCQVGDGTTTTRLTPVPLVGPPPIAQVSAGLNHSLARATDGSVWAWGGWQTGTGCQGSVPTRVDLPPAVALAAGYANSFVVVQAPPAASLTWTAPAVAEEPVRFSASASDRDGEVVSYLWDFGDGQGSEDPNPTHTYASWGTYTVRLTVTDDDGLEATASASLRVLARPRAVFQAPAQAVAGRPAPFTDASTDPDGQLLRWSWDFGDGYTSRRRHPDHIFWDPGTYTVRLTVTDDDGLSATGSAVVEVIAAPSAPQAFTASPGPGPVGEVSLSWQPPLPDAARPLDGYRLYRSSALEGRQLVASFGPQDSGFVDHPLPLPLPYRYELEAFNAAGSSPPAVACTRPSPWGLVLEGCGTP